MAVQMDCRILEKYFLLVMNELKLIAVLILPLALLRCQEIPSNPEFDEGSDIRYYSTIPLRESPYPSWQGVIQLTKKVSMQRNHYRFEFDSIGRITEISFRNGEIIIEPNHTANYFFRTPVIRFSYDSNLEIRTFFNRRLGAAKSFGAFQEIHVFDDLGRKSKLYFQDAEGKRMENEWGVYVYEWEHLMDGSVVERRFNQTGVEMPLRPGFDFHTIRLYYEQNGMLALMQNVNDDLSLNENSSGVAQDKMLFDGVGRWLGWRVLDANNELERGNGPDVATGINQSNKWGYEVTLHYEDEEGNRIRSAYGFGGNLREYDKYGNFSKTTFLDEAGKPMNNERTGYSSSIYTYSEDGIDRLRVDLTDADGNPVEHGTRGFAAIVQSYDQNHNLLKTEYLNRVGQLINRIDNGIAYTTHSYPDGSESIVRNFDKDGNELKVP